MDPYKILGVSKTASAEEVKAAYRKLCIEMHPDRHGGSAEAEEKFKSISAAYSILSDPDKRAIHDNPMRGGVGGINIDDDIMGFTRSVMDFMVQFSDARAGVQEIIDRSSDGSGKSSKARGGVRRKKKSAKKGSSNEKASAPPKEKSGASCQKCRGDVYDLSQGKLMVRACRKCGHTLIIS